MAKRSRRQDDLEQGENTAVVCLGPNQAAFAVHADGSPPFVAAVAIVDHILSAAATHVTVWPARPVDVEAFAGQLVAFCRASRSFKSGGRGFDGGAAGHSYKVKSLVRALLLRVPCFS